jgi:hypothetical protein
MATATTRKRAIFTQKDRDDRSAAMNEPHAFPHEQTARKNFRTFVVANKRHEP